MGLKNAAIVYGGRVAKCIEVTKGYATIVWIDHHDRIVTRSVPAEACVRFSEAVRPRSFWPDANMGFDLDIEKQDEIAARRNRRRVAKPMKAVA
jgi:hypothetical protein